jgi:hypothetical protein
MSRLRKSLTFSNVVAMVALFFALGGSVYAASNKISGTQIKPKSLPGNRIKAKSVTGTQIKNGSIGAPQLKVGAVSAGQIQSGSITGTQIKAGSISGTQIQSGSLGATQINQTTLTGISAANVHTVQYVTVVVPLNELKSGTATCPTGMKVIGGGAVTSEPKLAYINEAAPNAERSGWFAAGYGEVGMTMTITAICTPVAAPAG